MIKLSKKKDKKKSPKSEYERLYAQNNEILKGLYEETLKDLPITKKSEGA